MSFLDQKRRAPDAFNHNYERLRRGEYTDQYFNNIARILRRMAEKYSSQEGDDLEESRKKKRWRETGNRLVDFQIFNKREPGAVVVGVDQALAFLKEGCGYFDDEDNWVSTFDELEIRSVYDGDKSEPWKPVMRIRGRYRDFGYLETPLLGCLSRQSRIATNVYEAIKAAQGKPVLYFSARFDLPEVQESDGYAYKTAIDRYNYDFDEEVPVFISTDAQGAWFGGKGGGTTAHAYLLCFLKDTAEAMYHFADIMPPETKRIALVDVNNDCIADSLATAEKMFNEYLRLQEENRREEAEKFRLYGVRPDTSGRLRDDGVPPLGDPQLDCGVTPRLVWKMREAIDEAPETLDIPSEKRDLARKYYRQIKIFCTGGFTAEKIERFERLGVPADGYGVGSYFINGPGCDYTGDVVMAEVNGEWMPMAKVGRYPREYDLLRLVKDY